MFVPVKVEIAVGEICIGVLPVRLEMNLGIAYADMFRAECVKIKDVNGGERNCLMDFGSGKNIWVSDYRITDFTFGGVMVGNPKFDPIRIDKEDEAWLKLNLPKKKLAPTAKMAKIGGKGMKPTPGTTPATNTPPKTTPPSRPKP